MPHRLHLGVSENPKGESSSWSPRPLFHIACSSCADDSAAALPAKTQNTQVLRITESRYHRLWYRPSVVKFLLLKPITERKENVFFTCLSHVAFARDALATGALVITTCYNRRCRHCLLDDRARQVRQLGGPRAALPTRERRPPASPRGGAHEHALQLAARVPHVGLLAGAAVPRQGARRGDRAGEGGQMRRAAHDLRHDPQKCQGHW